MKKTKRTAMTRRVIPINSFQKTYIPELSNKKIDPIVPNIRIDKKETRFTVNRGSSCTNNSQIMPIMIEIPAPIFTESNMASMFCFCDRFAVVISFS